jgi:hypothetical protein
MQEIGGINSGKTKETRKNMSEMRFVTKHINKFISKAHNTHSGRVLVSNLVRVILTGSLSK